MRGGGGAVTMATVVLSRWCGALAAAGSGATADAYAGGQSLLSDELYLMQVGAAAFAERVNGHSSFVRSRAMDALSTEEVRASTVVYAGEGASPELSDSLPVVPGPGCFVWLPAEAAGCGRAKPGQWTKDLEGEAFHMAGLDPAACKARRGHFLEACGASQAQQPVAMAFLPGAEPVAPSEQGCYLWAPSSCNATGQHKQSWTRLDSRLKTAQMCKDQRWLHNERLCGRSASLAGKHEGVRMLFVPPEPVAPSEPGCYAWMPLGCPDRPEVDKTYTSSWSLSFHTMPWRRDSVTEGHDRVRCEIDRKQELDTWCGGLNTRMLFVSSSLDGATKANNASLFLAVDGKDATDDTSFSQASRPSLLQMEDGNPLLALRKVVSRPVAGITWDLGASSAREASATNATESAGEQTVVQTEAFKQAMEQLAARVQAEHDRKAKEATSELAQPRAAEAQAQEPPEVSIDHLEPVPVVQVNATTSGGQTQAERDRQAAEARELLVKVEREARESAERSRQQASLLQGFDEAKERADFEARVQAELLAGMAARKAFGVDESALGAGKQVAVEEPAAQAKDESEAELGAEGKVLSEAEGKAEVEAKEKAEVEAKEKAEAEAKEKKAEVEAKARLSKAEREARRKRRNAAKKAEREARERSEKEQKQAELPAPPVQMRSSASTQASLEESTDGRKDEAELRAQEAAEEEAEHAQMVEFDANKEKAELEAKEKAELEAKVKAELEAKEKAELEAKEKAELEAKKKTEAPAQKEKLSKEERDARRRERNAQKKAEREAQERASGVAKAEPQAALDAEMRVHVPSPRAAGCYLRLHDGCPLHPISSQAWHRVLAAKDFHECEVAKISMDSFCGHDKTSFYYIPGEVSMSPDEPGIDTSRLWTVTAKDLAAADAASIARATGAAVATTAELLNAVEIATSTMAPEDAASMASTTAGPPPEQASASGAAAQPLAGEQECRNAAQGEWCYRAVKYAMESGIGTHPERYPGLTKDSPFADFQTYFHKYGQASCQKPCPFEATAVEAATTQLVSPGGVMTSPMPSNREVPFQTITTTAPFLVDRVVADDAAGGSSTEIRESLLGGRRGSNADGPATGKPQEDDSALWLDALIQPQTGTEDSSGAAKDKLQQNASDGSTTADAADGSASTEGLHWDLGNSTDSPAATQDSTAAEQPETASEGIHWDLGDAATDVVGNSAPMESSTDETQPEKETSDDSAVWLDAVEKPEQGAADGSAAADDADDEDETAGAAESSTATVESLQDLWESPGPAQSSTAAGQPAQSAAADGPIAADGADSSASTQDTAAAEKDAAGDSGAWLAAAVSAETGGADGSAAADAADVQGVVSDSLASADGSAAASQVQRDASDDADIWLDAAEKPEAAAADSSAATESPNATERAEEGAEVTPDEEKAPARDAAVPPPIRQDAPPAHPSKPGCWLWMQGGCPRHPRQSLRDTWYRDRRGGLSHDTCERRMDSYQKFCGAVNMTFHFVASAPRSPKKAASPPPSVQSTREKFEDFEQKALEAVQKVVVTWTSPAPAAAAPPAPAGDVPGVPHGAPRLPSAPGCYLWTRGGCPKHPQRSKPASWQRDRRGFKDAFGCSQRRDTFDRYCGGNGTVFFYRSQASQDNASADPEPAPSELIPLNMSTGKYPQIPKEAGCYLWLHHGCPKHPHREYKSSWYNDRFGSDGWQACSERKDIFDRFCGTDSTVFKYIGAESAAGNTTAAAPSEEATPAPAAQEEPAAAPPSTTVAAPLDVPRVRPPVPREPGCYIWLTNGCPKHPHQEYRNDWMRDRSGHGSYTSCSYRKSVFDTFCGVDATVFAYVEETTSGMRVVSSSDPELDRAEIETGPSRQDSTDEAAAEAPSTTPVVPLGVSRWRSQIPQEPGCYVLLKSGCPNHPHKVYDGVWFADRSGQGSHDECTKRAGIFDAFCGVSDTATAYVVQGPTGLRIDSDGLGDEDAAATKPEPAADDANTTASEEDESDHPGEDVDGPKPELAAEGVNATAAEQDESDHPEEDVAAPQPEQANAAAEAQPEQEDVSFSHGDDEVGSDTGEDQPAEQAAAEEEWSDEALPVVADDAQGPEAAQRERRAQEARAAREADERAVREAEEESTREASQANEEKAERERALREDEERAEREAFERAERQLQEKAEAEGEAKAEASEAAAAEGPQGAASEGSGDEAYDKPLWDVSSAERNAFAKAAQAANEKAYEQTGHDAYEKAYEEATSAGEADTSDEVGDNASAYEKPVSNAELHELAKTVRKAKQRTGQEDAADEGANSTEECPLWCRSSRRAKQQSCSYARCSSCPMCASKEAEEGNVTGEAAAPARPLEAAGEAAEAAEVQTSEAESSPALPEETIDRAPEEASDGAQMAAGGEEETPAAQANDTEEMTEKAQAVPVVPEEEGATPASQANETEEIADAVQTAPMIGEEEEATPAAQANDTEEMTDEAQAAPVVPEEEGATPASQANETEEMTDEAQAAPVVPEDTLEADSTQALPAAPATSEGSSQADALPVVPEEATEEASEETEALPRIADSSRGEGPRALPEADAEEASPTESPRAAPEEAAQPTDGEEDPPAVQGQASDMAGEGVAPPTASEARQETAGAEALTAGPEEAGKQDVGQAQAQQQRDGSREERAEEDSRPWWAPKAEYDEVTDEASKEEPAVEGEAPWALPEQAEKGSEAEAPAPREDPAEAPVQDEVLTAVVPKADDEDPSEFKERTNDKARLPSVPEEEGEEEEELPSPKEELLRLPEAEDEQQQPAMEQTVLEPPAAVAEAFEPPATEQAETPAPEETEGDASETSTPPAATEEVTEEKLPSVADEEEAPVATGELRPQLPQTEGPSTQDGAAAAAASQGASAGVEITEQTNDIAALPPVPDEEEWPRPPAERDERLLGQRRAGDGVASEREPPPPAHEETAGEDEEAGGPLAGPAAPSAQEPGGGAAADAPPSAPVAEQPEAEQEQPEAEQPEAEQPPAAPVAEQPEAERLEAEQPEAEQPEPSAAERKAEEEYKTNLARALEDAKAEADSRAKAAEADAQAKEEAVAEAKEAAEAPWAVPEVDNKETSVDELEKELAKRREELKRMEKEQEVKLLKRMLRELEAGGDGPEQDQGPPATAGSANGTSGEEPQREQAPAAAPEAANGTSAEEPQRERARAAAPEAANMTSAEELPEAANETSDEKLAKDWSASPSSAVPQDLYEEAHGGAANRSSDELANEAEAEQPEQPEAEQPEPSAAERQAEEEYKMNLARALEDAKAEADSRAKAEAVPDAANGTSDEEPQREQAPAAAPEAANGTSAEEPQKEQAPAAAPEAAIGTSAEELQREQAPAAAPEAANGTSDEAANASDEKLAKDWSASPYSAVLKDLYLAHGTAANRSSGEELQQEQAAPDATNRTSDEEPQREQAPAAAPEAANMTSAEELPEAANETSDEKLAKDWSASPYSAVLKDLYLAHGEAANRSSGEELQQEQAAPDAANETRDEEPEGEQAPLTAANRVGDEEAQQEQAPPAAPEAADESSDEQEQATPAAPKEVLEKQGPKRDVAAPGWLPKDPGCYLWLPNGCPENPASRFPRVWRRDGRGSESFEACALRKRGFDRFCQTNDTIFYYIDEPDAADAPTVDGSEPGASEQEVDQGDATAIPMTSTTLAALDPRASRQDRLIASDESMATSGLRRPPMPSEPGCYLWMHHGCPMHPHHDVRVQWYLDRLGAESVSMCKNRKMAFDRFCGVENTVAVFLDWSVPEGAPAGPDAEPEALPEAPQTEASKSSADEEAAQLERAEEAEASRAPAAEAPAEEGSAEDEEDDGEGEPSALLGRRAEQEAEENYEDGEDAEEEAPRPELPEEPTPEAPEEPAAEEEEEEEEAARLASAEEAAALEVPAGATPEQAAGAAAGADEEEASPEKPGELIDLDVGEDADEAETIGAVRVGAEARQAARERVAQEAKAAREAEEEAVREAEEASARGEHAAPPEAAAAAPAPAPEPPAPVAPAAEPAPAAPGAARAGAEAAAGSSQAPAEEELAPAAPGAAPVASDDAAAATTTAGPGAEAAPARRPAWLAKALAAAPAEAPAAPPREGPEEGGLAALLRAAAAGTGRQERATQASAAAETPVEDLEKEAVRVSTTGADSVRFASEAQLASTTAQGIHDRMESDAVAVSTTAPFVKPLLRSGKPVPELPTQPGCYLWLHHGCPKHPAPQHAATWWRDRRGEASTEACEQRKRGFDRFCGVEDTASYFIEAALAPVEAQGEAQDDAELDIPALVDRLAGTTTEAPSEQSPAEQPAVTSPTALAQDAADAKEPVLAGARALAGRSSRPAARPTRREELEAEELPSQDAGPEESPTAGASGAQAPATDSLEAVETEAGGVLLGAAGLAVPELPRVPGCFLWVHHGCPLRPHAEYVQAWYEDAEGAVSRRLCELRRGKIDEFCGRSNTTMYFLPGRDAAPAVTEDAPLPAVPPPAAQLLRQPARGESAPAQGEAPPAEAPADARQPSRLRTPAPAAAAHAGGFQPAKAVEKARLAAGQAAGVVQQAAVSFVSKLSSALPWSRKEAAPASAPPLEKHTLQPLRMMQEEQQQ